jgi:hypothetical protein
MKNSEIKIYKTPNGETTIEVKLEKETVWLSQKQMAELFDKDSDTIGLHLRNIYKSGELDEESTTEYFSVVQKEGKRGTNELLTMYLP